MASPCRWTNRWPAPRWTFGAARYFVFEGAFRRERVGDLPTELVPHFFRSLCEAAGINLHLSVRGENDHHQVEACFKVVARALRQALRREGRRIAEHQGGAVSAPVVERTPAARADAGGGLALEVAVVDAGGANLGSVRYALERLGARSRAWSATRMRWPAPRA
jgi:hypothetical protein